MINQCKCLFGLIISILVVFFGSSCNEKENDVIKYVIATDGLVQYPVFENTVGSKQINDLITNKIKSLIDTNQEFDGCIQYSVLECNVFSLAGAWLSKVTSKVISKHATSSLFNKASDKIENTMKKIFDKEGYRMFDAGGRRIGSFEAEVLTLKGVAKSMKLPNVKGLPMRNKSIYKVVEKRILGDNVESMLTSGFSTIIGRVVG